MGWYNHFDWVENNLVLVRALGLNKTMKCPLYVAHLVFCILLCKLMTIHVLKNKFYWHLSIKAVKSFSFIIYNLLCCMTGGLAVGSSCCCNNRALVCNEWQRNLHVLLVYGFGYWNVYIFLFLLWITCLSPSFAYMLCTELFLLHFL